MAQEPKCAQKAPYVIEEQPGKKFWCACGHSAKQPYCDGSHARLQTGISPIPVDITEAKKVAWCGCKQSKNKPFCDGTHRSLP
jgi:CDGSH iron-sulfur domain-containing protein 3